jgi:hypothetical protein
MTTARDNFFKNCPAVMDYPSFTDFRSSRRREQYVAHINGITNDYDYKDFLTRNAVKIHNSEHGYLKQEYGCRANVCIHNSPTSPPPGDFNRELNRYNRARILGDVKDSQCQQLQDYRTSY